MYRILNEKVREYWVSGEGREGSPAAYVGDELRGLIQACVPRVGVGVDLCCGRISYGYLMLGMDLSAVALKENCDLGSRVVTDVSGKAIPIRDEAVDYVQMISGIAYLTERRRVFREIDRIMKREGVFLLGYDGNTCGAMRGMWARSIQEADRIVSGELESTVFEPFHWELLRDWYRVIFLRKVK